MRFKSFFFVLFSLLIQPISSVGQAVIKADIFWLPQTYRILNDWDVNAFKYNYAPVEIKSAGLSLGIFSKKYGYGLEAGFIYTNQGQTYDSTGINFLGRGVDSITQIKLNYFKIPLVFRYRTDAKSNRKGGFNFLIGAQASLLQSAEWISGRNTLTLMTSTNTPIPLTKAYKNFKIDLVMGIGYVVGLTDNLGVSIMARFDYSIVDIENKKFKITPQEYFYPEDRLASSSYTLSIGVGLTYSVFGRD